MINTDEMKVVKALLTLGAKPNRVGYAYLKESILMCLENPENVYRTKKRIHTIADNHNTTVVAVSRALYTATKDIFDNSNSEEYKKLVGKTGKLTLNEFIASLAENLRYSIG